MALKMDFKASFDLDSYLQIKFDEKGVLEALFEREEGSGKGTMSLYLSENRTLSKKENLPERRWLVSCDVNFPEIGFLGSENVIQQTVYTLLFAHIGTLVKGSEDNPLAFTTKGVTDKGVQVYTFDAEAFGAVLPEQLRGVGITKIVMSSKGLDFGSKLNYSMTPFIPFIEDCIVFVGEQSQVDICMVDRRYTQEGYTGVHDVEKMVLLVDHKNSVLSLLVLGTHNKFFDWSTLKTLNDVKKSHLDVIHSIALDFNTFNNFNIHCYDALSNAQISYNTVLDYLLDIDGLIPSFSDEDKENVIGQGFLYIDSNYSLDYYTPNVDKRDVVRKLSLVDFI